MTSKEGRSKRKLSLREEKALVARLLKKRQADKLRKRGNEARDKKMSEEGERLTPRERIKETLAPVVLELMPGHNNGIRMAPDRVVEILNEIGKEVCKRFNIEPQGKKKEE